MSEFFVSASHFMGLLDNLRPFIESRHARQITRLGARFDMDDLYQTVAMAIFRDWDKCRATTDAERRAWVMRIARNAANKATRDNLAGKRSLRFEQAQLGEAPTLDPPSEDVVPAVLAEINEELELVNAALDSLGAETAAIVRMRYEGATFKEIVTATGRSHASLDCLVRRSLEKLRTRLATEDPS